MDGRRYNKNQRRHVIALKRVKLFIAQEEKCFHCGLQMEKDDVTLEHIIPRCKNGTFAWENIVVVHKRCNARRALRPFDKKEIERAKEIQSVAKVMINHKDAPAYVKNEWDCS